MKKLLFSITLVLLTAVYGFSQSVTTTTPIPKYGCPNTTHDVTIGVTNASGISFPPNNAYSIAIEIYDNTPTQIFTETQNFTDGFNNGATKNITFTNIPFAGAMTCSTEFILTVGPIPAFMFPGATYNANGSYVVQLPPNLTITQNGADLNVTGAPGVLDGTYEVNYYRDGSFQALSTDGVYTPTVAGTYDYTAKAVQSTSGCLSAAFSNSLSITPVKSELLYTNISIYPNPMVESVTIENENNVEVQYELADMNGNVIKKSIINKTTKLDVQAFTAGTYLLTLKDKNNKTASYKLVK